MEHARVGIHCVYVQGAQLYRVHALLKSSRSNYSKGISQRAVSTLKEANRKTAAALQAAQEESRPLAEPELQPHAARAGA